MNPTVFNGEWFSERANKSWLSQDRQLSVPVSEKLCSANKTVFGSKEKLWRWDPLCSLAQSFLILLASHLFSLKEYITPIPLFSQIWLHLGSSLWIHVPSLILLSFDSFIFIITAVLFVVVAFVYPLPRLWFLLFIYYSYYYCFELPNKLIISPSFYVKCLFSLRQKECNPLKNTMFCHFLIPAGYKLETVYLPQR